MKAQRTLGLSAVVLLAGPRASSQALGQLLYTTRAGRAISLKIVDGGHPTLMRLKPEVGEAERFRLFVLAHAGAEGRLVFGSHPLPQKAPPGWRVETDRGDMLLKTPEATFWRYSANWVLPVRFVFDRQEWQLLSAQLPPRRFVALPDGR